MDSEYYFYLLPRKVVFNFKRNLNSLTLPFQVISILVCLSLFKRKGGTSEKVNLNQWDFKSPEVIFSTPGRLMKFYPLSNYFDNLKYIILNQPDFYLKNGKFKTFLSTLPSLSKKVIISEKEKEEFFLLLNKESETKVETKEEEEETTTTTSLVDLSVEPFEVFNLENTKKEMIKETIHSSSIHDILDKIISISKENLNLKIGIFLPTKYFVDYVDQVLKEKDLYSFHFHVIIS
jgi:superfamily II DNA/RNA helicase